ncbi:MAG: Zn-dependent hydrolase [Microbacterium sp.]|jgi:glyoxylase-like metal-dependent hydrolase (beta-lactamase superfamily II)|nr:Zn-dependent hydrolase [Microbacterium sp.]
MSAMRSITEVAPDFFRLCVADANCYLVRTAGGLTLVDAGLPATRGVLRSLLTHLGAREADIDAVVLTHGHFDHVGVARHIRAEGARVLVHSRDAQLARHPYSYRPATPRVPYLLSHPRGLPTITRMALAGALGVRGVEAIGRVHHGHPVDVPGSPVALWTPGHTGGHCAYFFEEAGVLLTGDALVTLDPYTGEEGPQIVASAATADTDEAIRSLDVLAETSAELILPGHGRSFRGRAATAVDLARQRGPH